MIQKFRWQFIYLSIASLAMVLIVTMGALIGFTYHQNKLEVDRVMDTLVRNGGELSPHNARHVFGDQKDVINRNFLAGQYNPEAIFQYRYFSVLVTGKKSVRILDDTNVYQINRQELESQSKEILANHEDSGTIRLGQNFYTFKQAKNKDGRKIIIFLNESLIFNRFKLLVRVGILLGIGALIVFAIILILISKRAIKPIIDNYHKQQEFITNAGHELKTPLAIISANTEMEEMLGNNSEWNQSTKEQVERLTKLINRLIALARTHETGEIILGKVNFSEIVKKDASSFKSMMQKKDIHYQVGIVNNIWVKAEQHSLTELVNILVDNAWKYCEPNGIVKVSLQKSRLGKHAILKVANSFKTDQKIDYQHFFDRFYRQDESHNSKKSGFGIGLAMAKDLVEAFGGKIHVRYKDQMIIFTVSLRVTK